MLLREYSLNVWYQSSMLKYRVNHIKVSFLSSVQMSWFIKTDVISKKIMKTQIFMLIFMFMVIGVFVSRLTLLRVYYNSAL